MKRKRTGVRVTLYLPDELRERARKADLNLSGLLRDAVQRELRGDVAEEGRPVAGAQVRARAVPGGMELTTFIPDGELPD